MSERVLEVRNLRTVFPGPAGEIPVVDDLSLHVERGEVLALDGLAPDGTVVSLAALADETPGETAAGAEAESLFLGLWALFLATVEGNVESPLMYLPVPFLTLFGLWWIRWWAVRAVRLQ